MLREVFDARATRREPRLRVACALGRRYRVGPRQLAGGAARLPPDRTRVGTSEAYASCGSPRSHSPTATTTTPSSRSTASDRSSAALASRSSSAGRARCGPSWSAGAATSRRPARLDDGLDAIEFCSEDHARIARLAQPARRSRPTPPSAPATSVTIRRAARDRPRGGLRRPRRGLLGRVPPVEQAQLASARRRCCVHAASRTRRHRRRRRGLARVERPYPAAIERLLEAQARRRAGTARPRATLGAARARAPAIGAAWLLAEIDGLAVRARLTLAGRRRRRPPPPRGRGPVRPDAARAARSSRCSPPAARTARSASSSSWPRRPRASTSRGSSPSSTCAAAPRRPRSRTASGSRRTRRTAEPRRRPYDPRT